MAATFVVSTAHLTVAGHDAGRRIKQEWTSSGAATT